GFYSLCGSGVTHRAAVACCRSASSPVSHWPARCSSYPPPPWRIVLFNKSPLQSKTNDLPRPKSPNPKYPISAKSLYTTPSVHKCTSLINPLPTPART
ncbi:hypothetical protein, partial [Schleiferia thermophila]